MNVRAADEAGEWDARLRAPDCSETDRARFAGWRDSDAANKQAFERLQSIIVSLRHDSASSDVRALRDEALRLSRRHRYRFWTGIAAAVGGMVAIGCLLRWSPELMAPRYSTMTGQRSSFVLDDGTSVELNAQSRMSVVFTQARREVRLQQGQALFNVAQSSDRPFVVRAGDREIVAMGTVFDVRLDGESVQVTLLEGKVRVATGHDAVELTPGKQLTAGSNVRDTDVAKVTGWRDGRIFLEDMSLRDAVAEMNKYSAVQVTMSGDGLSPIRVNGMFRAGEQEAFVAALAAYFPITAQRRGNREIMLTHR